MGGYERQQASKLLRASVIDTTTASGVSARFGSETRQVKFWASSKHYVLFSHSTGATVSSTSGMPLSSGGSEYFIASPGELVVTATDASTGQLWISEFQ